MIIFCVKEILQTPTRDYKHQAVNSNLSHTNIGLKSDYELHKIIFDSVTRRQYLF